MTEDIEDDQSITIQNIDEYISVDLHHTRIIKGLLAIGNSMYESLNNSVSVNNTGDPGFMRISQFINIKHLKAK